MESLDYTYKFNPIKDKHTRVMIIDHRKELITGKEYIEANTDDYDLLKKTNKRIPSIAADLIDIATAVHIADRLSVREADIPCRIEIIIPIRNLEALDNLTIIEKLKMILAWYTDDFWSIKFTYYSMLGRISEIQIPLTEEANHSTKVALWSGGLDSLAGLCIEMQLSSKDHFTLLGTGSNLVVHHLQKHVHYCVSKEFPNRTTLIQIPTRINKIGHLKKDSSQRTRGFSFLLIGIACAYSLGQNTLYLYENGIGAINLPFTKVEIGLDHSRAVHPLSLYYLSQLASLVFEAPFNVKNPFIFSTKAEMCQVLSRENTDLIFETVTCDRKHRKRTSQCGYCTSCLLRRQALAAIEIDDKTKYVIKEVKDRQSKESDSIPLTAMLSQVEDLRIFLTKTDPWPSMTKRYQWLQEIVDQTSQKEGFTKNEMAQNLVHLYEKYISEWDIARSVITAELL